MAYTPLTNNEMITGAVVDASLLEKINNNMEALSKKGVQQVVQNHTTHHHAYTGTTSRAGTEVTGCRTGIVTKVDNSKIKYELLLSGEVHWDNSFFLQRVMNGVVTEIGSGNPSGVRRYGFFTPPHGENVDSTPNQMVAQFLDVPNAPAGTYIEYRLRYYGSGAHILRVNYTYDTQNHVNYENTATNVTLTEIGELL